MFKILFAVIATVLVFQFTDIEEQIEPLLAPLLEMAEQQTEDGLPELGKQFLAELSSQDLSALIESPDFDLSQVSSMLEDQELNLDQLTELIESQEFDTEAAQQKLEELKKLVQEKIEENQ